MAISIQESINSQEEKTTHIVGEITQEGIDNLEE